MEKGQLFQVAYNGNDNSYKSDVFMFHAEDDRIVLASKINLTTLLLISTFLTTCSENPVTRHASKTGVIAPQLFVI